MKKKKKYLLILFCFVLFSLFGLFFYTDFFPSVILRLYVWNGYRKAGLEEKTLSIKGGKLSYAEGGKGPTLLCIHGFRADKKFWFPYSKTLQKKYHLIVLDLPGHGESDRIEGQHYDAYSLAKSVDYFVKAKGLTRFSLMGTSMGGGVSFIYAYTHPKQLERLILLNPLGVKPTIKSYYLEKLEQGKNLLLPKNCQEFEELTLCATGKPLAYNDFIKKYLMKQILQTNTFYQQVFQEMMTTTPIDSLVTKMHVRTLVLVGDNDRVLHPSWYEKYKDLPNKKYVVIPQGSHIFVDEHLKKAEGEIEEFLQEAVE